MKHQTPAYFGLSVDIWGGLALLGAAVVALLVVNLGGAEWYHHTLEHLFTLGFTPFAITKTAHHWVNDGLMVLFFVLVGIEIQREVLTGSLRTPKQAMLPVLAAMGGFVGPALVYLCVVQGDATLARGWSIPTATDIAFVVALMAVLKDYVPNSLRVFLLALAVADDLMAILVIALFYTAEVVWMNLFLAAVGLALLVLKNRFKLVGLWMYLVVGFFVWLCVSASGVHATVAGVMIGLVLPLHHLKGHPHELSPADKIEHALQPFVRWVVLPLFAFANVGIDMRDMTLSTALAPLTLALIAGLFVGKQLGIFGTVWALDRFTNISRPVGTNWWHIYGAAALCGIGFTMTLFIAALAFDPSLQTPARLGVIVGSVLSAVWATDVFVRLSKKVLH